MFSCEKCLTKGLTGRVHVSTLTGDTFRLLLLPEPDRLGAEKRLGETLEELRCQELQESALKWSRVCSLIGESELSAEELELISSRMQDFTRDHQEDT